MKIIFMGTSEFAVPILKHLLKLDYIEVIAVYTQPPRQANRGKKLQYSPIYQLADSEKIPIYSPISLRKSEEEQNKIFSMKPDKIIVASYGLILPKKITDSIKCINIHPSSLPRWRGAAPIQRTIMAGDKKTSICVMLMNEFMDEGDILISEEILLTGKERFEDLSEKLAIRSGYLLEECLKNFDEILPKKQSNENITHADKISKEEALIDWQEDAEMIERKSRAFSPNPSIYFEYNNIRIKIIEANVRKSENNDDIYKAGTIIDKNFSIKCGKDILEIKKIQKSGKNIMYIEEFLRGFPFNIGDII